MPTERAASALKNSFKRHVSFELRTSCYLSRWRLERFLGQSFLFKRCHLQSLLLSTMAVIFVSIIENSALAARLVRRRVFPACASVREAFASGRSRARPCIDRRLSDWPACWWLARLYQAEPRPPLVPIWRRQPTRNPRGIGSQGSGWRSCRTQSAGKNNLLRVPKAHRLNFVETHVSDC